MSGILHQLLDTMFDRRMVFSLGRRLPHVSPQDLSQLTSLLRLPTWHHSNFADPCKFWLAKQKDGISKLGPSLRGRYRPNRRWLWTGERHTVRLVPGRANLCAAHNGLDQRIVREVMLLICDECTIRCDRYRSWHSEADFSNLFDEWLSAMDVMTTIWIGRDGFKSIFHRSCPDRDITSVRDGCEACMSSIFGGRPEFLSNLRAGLEARRALHQQGKEETKHEPRLLQLVDCWIGVFDKPDQEHIRGRAAEFVSVILDAHRRVVKCRRVRDQNRLRAGKKLGKKVRRQVASYTEAGLPMPRQYRNRKSHGTYKKPARALQPDIEKSRLTCNISDCCQCDEESRGVCVCEFKDKYMPSPFKRNSISSSTDSFDGIWPKNNTNDNHDGRVDNDSGIWMSGGSGETTQQPPERTEPSPHEQEHSDPFAGRSCNLRAFCGARATQACDQDRPLASNDTASWDSVTVHTLDTYSVLDMVPPALNIRNSSHKERTGRDISGVERVSRATYGTSSQTARASSIYSSEPAPPKSPSIATEALPFASQSRMATKYFGRDLSHRSVRDLTASESWF